MASIDRTTIVEGPAIVVFGNKTYYTRDAIEIDPGLSTFDVEDSVNGIVDTRIEDIVGTISFRPVGVWGNLTPLYTPFASPVLGSSLLGTTDADAVIWSIDGRKITVHGAGVTSLPDLTFSAVEQFAGQAVISFIGKNDVAWDDTNTAKRYVEAAAAFADAGYDPATVLTQPYAVSYGGTSIETESGVTVSFKLESSPRKTDSYGTVDIRLDKFSVEAKFRPVGMSASTYLALFKQQGSGVIRGASLGTSNALVISGTGVYFALNGAAVREGGLKFAAGENRAGEITLQAVRRYASSALQPLFAIANAAPSVSQG